MMVQALLMLVSVHLDYGFVLLIQVGIHFHLTFRQDILGFGSDSQRVLLVHAINASIFGGLLSNLACCAS
jgi:hypothetical protein